MLTLCLDTSYKMLSCCLIEDGCLIASSDEVCFKKQSEMVFVRLRELFEKAERKPLDIDAIAIAVGPGSYTGVRIAMTVAKTIASVSRVKLYGISTLKLYAGHHKDTVVLLDARRERAYTATYDQGNTIVPDQVLPLSEIKTEGKNVVGDGSLLGLEDQMPCISECFLNCFEELVEVEDVDHLVPVYLKESESYLQ